MDTGRIVKAAFLYKQNCSAGSVYFFCFSGEIEPPAADRDYVWDYVLTPGRFLHILLNYFYFLIKSLLC